MENKKEVSFSRVFDSSPERVWKAWTDPKEIVKWWGPDNVSIPECEIDLRVGGRIYIVMEAGEAIDEPMVAVCTPQQAFEVVVVRARPGA